MYIKLSSDECHWTLLMISMVSNNIGSGNGLVPSGNKPLPQPMLSFFMSLYGATMPHSLWPCTMKLCVDCVYAHKMSCSLSRSYPINWPSFQNNALSQLLKQMSQITWHSYGLLPMPSYEALLLHVLCITAHRAVAQTKGYLLLRHLSNFRMIRQV